MIQPSSSPVAIPFAVSARHLLIFAVIGLSPLPLLAQEDTVPFERPTPLTRVSGEQAAFVLDGRLDEAIWDTLPVIDNMQIIQPDTMEPAPFQTHTRVFYNDRGIYVGVMNYQPADSLVSRMSSRDEQSQRDSYGFVVDPSGTGLYGYFLRINLGGSLNDGTVLPERQINRQWDGPWDSASVSLDDGWSAEMFLPWSMMSLPQADEGATRTMGIYIERVVAARGETWSWPALPRNSAGFLSAFHKVELSGVNPSTQFTLYPYVSSTFDDMKDATDYRVGTDLYWRPSSNMQVSAALNPDFGTVESDDVVVNLGAFETFFEEKLRFKTKNFLNFFQISNIMTNISNSVISRDFNRYINFKMGT